MSISVVSSIIGAIVVVVIMSLATEYRVAKKNHQISFLKVKNFELEVTTRNVLDVNEKLADEYKVVYEIAKSKYDEEEFEKQYREAYQKVKDIRG